MEIRERIERITKELDALREEYPGAPWAFVASPKMGEMVSDFDGDRMMVLGLLHIVQGHVSVPIVMGSVQKKPEMPRIVPARMVPLKGAKA